MWLVIQENQLGGLFCDQNMLELTNLTIKYSVDSEFGQ